MQLLTVNFLHGPRNLGGMFVALLCLELFRRWRGLGCCTIIDIAIIITADVCQVVHGLPLISSQFGSPTPNQHIHLAAAGHFF